MAYSQETLAQILGVPKAALNYAIGESDYSFYDSFARYPDGPIAGKSPLIGSGTWLTNGAGVSGEGVVSGAWTSTGGITYAVMNLASTPWEYGCVFESRDGVNFLPIVACIKDYPGHGFGAMFHPNVIASTPSSSYFSPTYWNDTWNGAASQQVSVGFTYGGLFTQSIFALAGNTKYRYRIVLNPPFADMIIEKLDGTTIATNRVYDPVISSIIGPYIFVETGNPNYVIHEVYTRQKPAASTSTYMKNAAGIDATPIGQSFPAGGQFSVLHAGLGGPAGTFSVRTDGTASVKPTIRSTGTAAFEVKAENNGFTSEVDITNGGGGTAVWKIDGGYVVTHASSQGVYLTKPFNANPYFAGGVGIGGSSGPLWLSGTGAPAVAAPVGSLYSRTDGGATSTLYVKETGTGTTGWVAK